MAAVEIVETDTATERLEAEVCTLAGHIAAATCRFVLLIAELDRREAWKEWGCRSMAQWLSWKCALGRVAATEHVRVGRALETLPLTRDAFSQGTLSYSKVRALTRVATPEREPELLDFASVATASQLERTVRLYERARSDAPTERDRIDHLHVRTFDNPNGTVTTEIISTREQADLISAAIREGQKEVPFDPENVSAETRPVDALELIVRAFLAGRSERIPTEVVIHAEAGDLAPDTLSPVLARALCDTSIRVVTDEGTVRPRTRTIPVALNRAMRRRDLHGCRFPGCHNDRFLHVHHIVHFAREGPTDSHNCVMLCTFHHRAVHEGGWSIWGDADRVLTFASPNGRRFTDAPAPAKAHHFRPDGRINATTIATATGERLDLAYALDAFHGWLSP